MIIRFFHEATQMLSEDDCSVSMSIPIVATIQKALQVHSSDTGVKTLKRGLHESMTQRFGDMETIPEYSVATFLDPRYKHFYFQNMYLNSHFGNFCACVKKIFWRVRLQTVNT